MHYGLIFISLCATASLDACFCKGKSDQVLEHCIEPYQKTTRNQNGKVSSKGKENPVRRSLCCEEIQKEFELGDYQELYGKYPEIGPDLAPLCERDSEAIVKRIAKEFVSNDSQNSWKDIYTRLKCAIESLEEYGIHVPEDYHIAVGYFRAIFKK